MLIGPVLTIASSGLLGADLGTLGAVVLASAASGAVAIPAARSLGIPSLFARRRTDPASVAATLIACAAVARRPGFNVGASATADPLLARAVVLAASDAGADEVRRELDADPPAAPRPVIALAPVIGLLLALCGLAGIVVAMSHGTIAGPSVAAALVIALYAAFTLSAAVGAVSNWSERLDPADVLARAMIAAAVPAIRAGATGSEVEQILRPLTPPQPAEPLAGRLAA